MKKLLLIPLTLIGFTVASQSVGIGTSTPHSSSSLDLGASARPLVLPRLTTAQMNAVSAPVQGMIVYNIDEHQLYSYMRYASNIIGLSNNRWQPVSTGPRMLAWGIVDSFGVVRSGSGNFSVNWDEAQQWYKLSLVNPHEYYKDTMMLFINPVGNGSWDQTVSTGEVIEGTSRSASIKFIDVSRIAAGWSVNEARRRSWFHFALYDLRKDPY